VNLSRWINQNTALDLRTLTEIEIAVNLSIKQISIGWNSSYCEVKLLLFPFPLDYVNLKQYPDAHRFMSVCSGIVRQSKWHHCLMSYQLDSNNLYVTRPEVPRVKKFLIKIKSEKIIKNITILCKYENLQEFKEKIQY